MNVVVKPPVGGESFDAVIARLVPLQRLMREKDVLRERYLAAKPYPHLILDGYFDDDALDRIASEFPSKEERDWIAYDTAHELKQTSRGISGLHPFTQQFLLQTCSREWLSTLGEITGVDDLVADPLFLGGGLHESFRGGWLNMHTDWTKHAALPLTRKLNMIVYLNRDWDPSWGGALELWDPETKECGAKVDPIFNRAVIFPTTDYTLHGFPNPMTCPEDRSRKSVSLFYWSPAREAIKDGTYITFLPGNGRTKRAAFLRSLIPPIAFQAVDTLKRVLTGQKIRGWAEK